MVEYLMKKIYKVVEGDSLRHLNYDSLSFLFPSNTDQRDGNSALQVYSQEPKV